MGYRRDISKDLGSTPLNVGDECCDIELDDIMEIVERNFGEHLGRLVSWYYPDEIQDFFKDTKADLQEKLQK
jgi:hypothetical protein